MQESSSAQESTVQESAPAQEPPQPEKSFLKDTLLPLLRKLFILLFNVVAFISKKLGVGLLKLFQSLKQKLQEQGTSPGKVQDESQPAGKAEDESQPTVASPQRASLWLLADGALALLALGLLIACIYYVPEQVQLVQTPVIVQDNSQQSPAAPEIVLPTRHPESQPYIPHHQLAPWYYDAEGREEK